MRSEDQELTWRDNWFVINWLGAIPVIRSLRMKSISECIDTAAMDSSMILGGFLFMQFNLFDLNMMEKGEKPKFQMFGEMVSGMGAGMFAYHNVREAIKFSCSKSCDSDNSTRYQSLP